MSQVEEIRNISTNMCLLILALMNDGMQHRKESITETIINMGIIPDEMNSAEFDNLLGKIHGHGGYSVNGKCSICLGIVEVTNAN